jgi:lysophospholipase L1-like esterase
LFRTIHDVLSEGEERSMRPTTVYRLFALAIALLVVPPALTARGRTPPATAPAVETKWIDAWAVSFLPTTVNGTLQSSRTFENQTLRLIVFAKLGGTKARVKFTNRFTAVPLIIGAAHIALRSGGSAIDAGSDRALTFGGRAAVTIPPGEELWSDPVPLVVKEHTDLAVSVFVPDSYRPTGFHRTGLKTSYIGAGDLTAAVSFPAGAATDARGGRSGSMTTDQVFLVSGLQVLAPASTHVIVTLGDSITDGAASDTDANGSWPDVLSKRLPKLSDGTPVSVINMGIGSNRFVSADRAGPTGTQRLDDDVLARPNVTHLIVLEGINDISYEQVKPDVLIEAYKSVIARAHAKGIRVLMATLLPIQDSVKDTPANLAAQQAVNTWIRAGEGFDGVIDFESVVQDPQNPLRIRANLTGDFVHPNTQGYRLMGESIDLSLFEERQKGAAGSRRDTPAGR